jgi:hypothetical protein
MAGIVGGISTHHRSLLTLDEFYKILFHDMFYGRPDVGRMSPLTALYLKILLTLKF